MKKHIALLLAVCMVFTCISFGTGYNTTEVRAAENKVSTSEIRSNDLLNNLMNEYTSFILIKQRSMGGSHYAYTEGLSDELVDPNAPDGVESNFFPGSQMVLLELTKNGDKITRKETVLLESNEGVLRDPDVSEDGTKVLFSWKKNLKDDYHLYEYDLKTKQTTQLTFGSGTADFEPKYLPDGKIVFSSSRIIQTIDCWKTPVSNIYTCNADGSNITRLGYDQVHTTYPTVTSDGRVLYTRWDYNDRNQMYVQGVFQMFPDGTNQTEVYGNGCNFPTTLLHTREIPGTTDKYISIASGHHTYQAGKLVVVDTSKGRNSQEAIDFVVEDQYTTRENSIDTYGQQGALYKYPYAINENLFLTAYCESGWAGDKTYTPFGIYLFDMNGNKTEVVAGNDRMPPSQIVPVKARTMFERASMVNYAKDTGTYYVANVYEGEGLEGVEVGTAKYLRVVALDYRPYSIGATIGSGEGTSDPYSPVSTGNGSWDVKRVLGVVPIEEDGSALFTVPSETPIYFQVLDAEGCVIQSMRSWSTLMPGESYSCVGCHEDKNTVPPANYTTTQAMAKGVQNLQPDLWQTGEGYEDYDPYTDSKGFDYLEEIQPIWDASCVECHSNLETAYETVGVSAMPGADTSLKSTPLAGNATWSYTTDAQNGDSWYQEDFDDSSWLKGAAPFGKATSGPGQIGTVWDSDKIYMRTEFKLTKYQYMDLNLAMSLACMESPKIYVNGQLVYETSDSISEYQIISVEGAMKNAMKVGSNTIAITAAKSSSDNNFVGVSIDATGEMISRGSQWKYKMSRENKVDSNWNKINFNDDNWQTGTAPFGDRDGYKTEWNGDNKYIWIRKTFEIDNVEEYRGGTLKLNTFYDDNPKFYLNGNLIYEDKEGDAWVDGYTSIDLGDLSKHLVTGTNVLAIQCSNDTGGRQIDTSLTLTKAGKNGKELLKKGASGWKYTINSNPGNDWMQENYNDSSWKTGDAPFGSEGNCRTQWKGDNSDIWLRKTFTVDDINAISDMKMFLDIFYDEDPTVYINGTQVYSAKGYLTEYKQFGVSSDFTSLLKQGSNTIAIHAHNSVGGLFIDTGLQMKPVPEVPFSLESTNVLGKRMKKNFPISYLLLTGTYPSGENWIANSTNEYTNWISSMSQCEVLDPYQYGSKKSTIIKKLRNGHGNLTEEQIRKVEAWIDLEVPAYGAYDRNNTWGGNEIRWAEQYMNKREFFGTMDTYAKASRAGMIEDNPITIIYHAKDGEDYNISQSGMATLYVGKSYTGGDKVTIKLPEGEKYAMICLNSMMGEELVYVPNGEFTYTIPEATNVYPQTWKDAVTNTITARLPEKSELTEQRNLAQNIYDLDGAVGSYPHATAKSAYGNQAEFEERNAIDGFTANTGHGNYPYQSWGPKNDDGKQWMQVDFGNEVYTNEVEIYIRADFPHDTHYISATLEFSDGTEKNIVMKRTKEAQVFTFDTIKTSYIKVKDLTPSEEGTQYWPGITELKVNGYVEEPKEPEVPTEPTEPSEPEEPTEPSEPTEPTAPEVPTEPTGAAEPTGTEKPTVPTNPTGVTEPTAPTNSTDVMEPTVPTNSTDVTKPTVPTNPTDVTEPTTPSVPVTPTAPTDATVLPTAEETAIMNTLGVTAEVAKQVNEVVKQYNISGKTLAVTENNVIALKSDADVAGSTFAKLQAKAAKQTKTSVKLKWNKVEGADGYLVYGNKCGKKNSYKLLSTVVGKDVTSYTQKGLKKGTYYKYLVCAYKEVAGVKVTLAASKTIHTITKGGKFGVAKAVSVTPAKLTLKVGKTKKLVVKEVKAGLKMKSHRKISFESSNTNIATVEKNGKVTGKKKGSCFVYVYAQNGICKKIKVKVK